MSRVRITPPPEQGTGTVTSVGLTMPTGFNVANSPVTGAGTLVVTLDTLDASKISGGTFATTEAIFTTDATTKVPVTINGLASQTGHLQDWKKDGNLAAHIGSNGGLRIYGLADITHITLNGNASQTQKVVQYVNSSSAQLFTITKDGNVVVGTGNTATSSFDTDKAWTNPASAINGYRSNLATTLSADNANNIRLFYSDGTLNQGGFNYTGSFSGALYQPTVTGSSGAVSNLIGVGILIQNANTGTVINGFGLLISPAVNSGTLGTNYGIFVSNQTAGSTNYSAVFNAGLFVVNEGGAGAGSQWRFEGDNDENLLYGDTVNDRDGFGTASPETKMHGWIIDAAIATVTDVLKLTHDSTGTPAANFGTGIVMAGESSTTSNQLMGRISWLWTAATHASRKARGVLSAYDTAERTCISWEASGTAPMVGFFGTAPVIQQTGGADTAGALYTATEQGMLQRVYDAVRAVGIMN